MTTHAVLIVDHSGSMYNLRDDVIGGVNSYLDGLEGDVRVSCMLFNTDFHIAFRDRPPKRAKRLSQKIYNPHGGTALYDAIYFACKEKLMGDQPRDKFRRAIVMLSDGEDNDSRYSREQALVLGHAVPMPMMVRTRKYDPVFYASVAGDDATMMVSRARRYEEIFGNE